MIKKLLSEDIDLPFLELFQVVRFTFIFIIQTNPYH